ncbi:fluoride efflux transporter FluC [Staphylococcus edaphicus]|uniref:Fluoride-specific ion channel FluC n=1 Tax=Staphylococcus edaphicus TaxID=1955013 RepID=A0A2C6WRX3_9STAP|nr:CrcB family protein [Staphylococcus edaphicus]PHK50853.1 camphor resistance protein CrcB [Staphylococcus edaphicus]UQW82544.1 CrcB family protein [Staphylococcus edaphicus]
MINCILVMLGGGIGAVIRGFITNVFNQKFNSTLPIATLTVNVLGSFVIGLLMGMAINLSWMNPFIIVGILGGLTTFSTLSSELVKFLLQPRQLGLFIFYSLLQYGISFGACFLGYQFF